VQDRQQGTRRIYSTDPRGVKVLRDYLDRILPRDWDEALGACGGAVP
jgi:hypothetical protein